VQRNLFQQVTLSDYVFDKSKLFAYLTLDDNELLIYDKLYGLLAESVPAPDLVVYLQAPTEVLLRRIRQRGRPEEEALTEEYLAEVNRPTTILLPLLPDAAAGGQHQRGRLRAPRRGPRGPAQQIRGMGRGTQYYVPLAGRA